VRQGHCQLRDTVPPTPVRITRCALEGGAGGTLEYLLRAYTGPRRDVRSAGSVIPVDVSPMRPSPPLPHQAGRCGDIPALLGRAGTRHRHNGHCATYGLPVNGTLELAHHVRACKLLPPWPIKGGGAPSRRGQTRDDGQQSLTRSLPSPRHWHSPQSNLWYLEATPPLPPRL
jgi:hypothetical protein